MVGEGGSVQTYLVIVQSCMVVIRQFLVLCYGRGERVQGLWCGGGGGGGPSADSPSYCPELCMVVIQQFLVLCHSRGGEGSGGVVWSERGAQCRPTLLLSRVAW